MTALLLATTALTAACPGSRVFAQNLPTGGSVAAGSVSMSNPSPTQLNVTQSSQSAVVNYQTFSIGQGYSVNVQQPGSTAGILFRVTGDSRSTIAGSLTANGQVYLVNPNGIAITSTGVINTGGFVASTLGISDADFMAGRRTFTGNGASAAVTNAGTITVGRGGYAALLGGTVANSGNIFVPLGKVGLGSGERATLDFSGDGFLQVALPTAAGDAGALIRHSGTIKANGGSVVISAATAREAARNAVNISGLVQARTIGGRSGAIVIGGGAGGDVKVTGTLAATSRHKTGGTVAVTGRNIALEGATVDVSGKTGGGAVNIGGGFQGQGPLQRADTVSIDKDTTIRADARATGNGGNVVVWSDRLTTFAGTITARGGAQGGAGGDAEVSGKALLDYTGFTDLSAAKGAFGTLLLDPYNVTISSGADTTGISGNAFTANADDSVLNVTTLQTALGSANVTVSTGSGGSQAGNITVAAPLAWSAATTLTLNAAGAVIINAPISINGAGGLSITATAQSGITTTGLTFGNGASVSYAGGGSIAGQSFTLNGASYTLVYTMAQLDAIDGLKSNNGEVGQSVAVYGSGVAGRYALANDLNAGGTTYGRALVGDNSSNSATTRFGGRFDGLGHSISNLDISGGSGNNVGLFGYLNSTATISNVGLRNPTVTGNQFVGSLVGLINSASAVVQTSYAIGGTVSGASGTGGLIGRNGGTVQSSYANVSVSGVDRTGGLIGYINDGLLQTSYATGDVSGSTATGGLVGQNGGSGTILTSYATGAVAGSTDYTGGLVGANVNSSSISNSYSTGAVSSSASTTGGLIGINDASTVSASYWDTQTSGRSTGIGSDSNNQSGNVFGRTTAQLQGTGSASLGGTFSGGAAGGTAGLYPYLTLFFPGGPQVISGFAYKDGGATPLASNSAGAAHVTLNSNGATALTTTGANGYYYYIAGPGGTLPNGISVLAYTSQNASTGSNVAVTLVTSTGATHLSGVNVYGHALTVPTSATSLSSAPTLAQAQTTASAAAGGDSTALANIAALTGRGLVSSGTSFTVDQPVTTSGTFVVQTGANAPITVSQPVTITGSGSLGLFSGGALTIDSTVSVTGAGAVALSAAAQSGITTTGLTFGNGASIDYGATDNGGSFRLNGTGYTLVYTMAQLDAIDGVNAVDGSALTAYGAGTAGSYALATSLNAAGTTYTRALIATNVPTTSANRFSGRLDGLGHTVTGLTINAPTTDFVGMIGFMLGGTVSNIGLVNASVTADQLVGSLVGFNSPTGAGTIQTSYASGSVTGTANVGGLVGRNSGTVQASYANVAVTAGSDRAGGLVGQNNAGTIRNSYATGTVNGGADESGGLVGVNLAGGSVVNSYSTGAVSGAGRVGGLIGTNDASTVTASYWDTRTSGQPSTGIGSDNNSQSANVTGRTTAQLQGALPASFSAIAWGTGTGLYPYLNWKFAAGMTPQTVTGIATKADGTVLSGAAIAGTVNGAAFADGTVTSGANGYYYFVMQQGTIASGNGVFTNIAGNALKANSYLQSAAGSVANLDLRAGTLNVTTSATSLSAVAAGLAGVVGSTTTSDLMFTTPGNVLTPKSSTGVTIAASGAFSVDQNLVAPNAALITATGMLTIASSGSVTSSSGDATLVAGTAFVNNRGADAVSAGGRWLIYSVDPSADTRGSLAHGFKQYAATYGATSVAGSGNGFLYSVAPTVTASLVGTITKGYDGTTTATIAPANFAATGTIDGDAVTFNYAGAAYADPDLGTNKTVTATGVSLATATNGAAIVYGYTLGSTTATGNVGAIVEQTATTTPPPPSVPQVGASTIVNTTYTGTGSPSDPLLIPAFTGFSSPGTGGTGTTSFGGGTSGTGVFYVDKRFGS
ncbi:MAG: filamentous hemagglutinin N-terminal domain-containing protein [Xanthobacteraceae bacterium]|nr:filamentous hemagglutinin N-terminal domain-containing protein [Xanthobacteraceae bacterium]